MKAYDLVIDHATLLTMDADNTVIRDGIIGIKNGVITLLEEARKGVSYPADEYIDAQGMVAFPGFINTHVHCFQSLLKGLGADLPLIGWLNSSVQPFGVRVTRRQQELAARIACLEALKSGCTTLCEFFYTNQDPELADVCIETMQSVGIRSVLMRTFQDYGEEYNTPSCYIEPVETAIKEVERLRRKYLPLTGDMLSIWTGPDVTWATTKRGYEAILEYCLDQHVRYTMHLKETPEDDDMCRRHYGTGIVELLDEIGFLTNQFLAVHCVHLTPCEIEILAEVAGEVTGLAGIESMGNIDKVRHRADFGISIDRAWWGLGIGRALTEACIECARKAGYEQLELNVVADNTRAISMYERAGFVEFGRNPRGFKSRMSGYQELVYMRLEL